MWCNDEISCEDDPCVGCPAGPPPLDRHVTPEVVTLCGSTRFARVYAMATLLLTNQGKVVFGIGAHFLSDDQMLTSEDLKKRYDVVHKAKIDMSDSILVLNVGGYIGEQTAQEIEYAKSKGKVIRYLEPVGDNPLMIF
jgi:hypothetical protein